MEFDNCCPTYAITSGRDAALNDTECVMHWVTNEAGAERLTYETGLREPTYTMEKDAARLFMECAIATQTLISAKEDMSRTVNKSSSDATGLKPTL